MYTDVSFGFSCIKKSGGSSREEGAWHCFLAYVSFRMYYLRYWVTLLSVFPFPVHLLSSIFVFIVYNLITLSLVTEKIALVTAHFPICIGTVLKIKSEFSQSPILSFNGFWRDSLTKFERVILPSTASCFITL